MSQAPYGPGEPAPQTAPQSAPSAPPSTPPARSSNPARTRFIITWVVIGVLVLAAAASALGSLNHSVYGPRGTVSQYFDALQNKDAQAALAVPGVALSSSELKDAGLPENASAALLRPDVMSAPTDVELTSENTRDDGVHELSYDYEINGQAGSTTFELEKAGGFLGGWKFAASPLASVNLTVNHTTQFQLNGFDVDTRQVSPKGTKPAFNNTVNILVFAPGSYIADIDTDYLDAEARTTFVDTPSEIEESAVEAKPNDDFVEEVSKQLNKELDKCTEQEVLQPTGCPFGYQISDRVSGKPDWSIDSYPEISIEPGSDSWVIPESPASAQIDLDVQSLADGSITNVSESVPFDAFGNVYLFSDGTITTQLLTDQSETDQAQSYR